MKAIRSIAAAMLMLATSACSTVLEGRTQEISVDTVPTGANCVIKDNDIVLARVQTPGVATIEKSKNDVLVECAKDGYIANKKRNRADMAITGLGNMALGKLSFVGDMVDTASGAAHKYDSRVFMKLTPLPPVAKMDAPLSSQVPEPASDVARQEQLPEMIRGLMQSQPVLVTNEPLADVLRKLANGEQISSASPVTGQDSVQLASMVHEQPYSYTE